MHPGLILVPMTSALLYAFGSLFLKQGLQNGSGTIRSLILTNFIMSACFMPTLAWHSGPINWSVVYWPLLTGVCFFGGQAFTVWAIKTGDVSVQTPLMGTKVVFVAAFSMFLAPEPIPLMLWVSAGITAIAVFLLGQSNELNFHAVRKAVILSLIACVFFGATDSLVAAKSTEFGRVPMMVGMMLTLSVCSLGLIPFAQAPLFRLARPAWVPMLAGSVLMGLQALILNVGLSFLGNATTMNVVYSIRGLFGILLVWFVGKRFANRERETAGTRLMQFRFAGALLLMLAIGLMFF